MSNKMPIQWHKECLKNALNNLERERVHVQAQVDGLLRNEKRVQQLARQIDRAEREGKEGFDNEKFLTSEELEQRKSDRRRAKCRECPESDQRDAYLDGIMSHP